MEKEAKNLKKGDWIMFDSETKVMCYTDAYVLNGRAFFKIAFVNGTIKVVHYSNDKEIDNSNYSQHIEEHSCDADKIFEIVENKIVEHIYK